MTKGKIALLGCAAVLLLAAGAQAQDYRYERSDDRMYDRAAYDDRTETVIVHPYYDDIYKRQITGRVNGEINPTEYAMSRPVDFSDLDLADNGDRAELHARVHETAVDLCAQLDERVPSLRGDRSADCECVRRATRQAMEDVSYRERY